MKIRALKPDEIEVRVQQCKEKGCSLLLYKTARADMNVLDEVVGPMNWERVHTRDNMNCIVRIWDIEKKMWISKEDTGSESNTEAKKGLASDSFKRACFNWGIGRELYSVPFIWINLTAGETTPKNGKHQLSFNTKFKVSEIVVSDEKIITGLVITDQNNKTRFTLGKITPPKKQPTKPPVKTTPKSLTSAEIRSKLKEQSKEHLDKIFAKYNVFVIEELKDAQLVEIAKLMKWSQ
jgi:hypothetical protein